MATNNMADGNTINLLANLLKNDKEEDEDELDNGLKQSPYATPGSIGPSTSQRDKEVLPSKMAAPNVSQGKGKDIWKTEDVSIGMEHDYNDPREEPEYELLFRQAVGSEDVFLGMGGKTPLTSSCKELLVKIKLPNTVFKDIELIITEKYLDCRAPNYRLGLHLPHSVDADSSTAKWHDAKNVLEVTLKMIREYDFINQ